MGFSHYDIDIKKFIEMYPSYLQSPGTQLMNTVRLKYDLLNEFKNRTIEFWELFDIDVLESRYINYRTEWERNNPDGEWDDSMWVFTGFVENLCKSFEITREYYSYYANDKSNFPEEGDDWKAPGSVRLNNLNMLRMLKIRRSGSGYDGSRESLETIIKGALSNRILDDGEESVIKIYIRTITEEKNHASLAVMVVRPSGSGFYWTKNDEYLVRDGEYFINLLGIEVEFQVYDVDTLVYDSGKYSGEGEDGKKYR